MKILLITALLAIEILALSVFQSPNETFVRFSTMDSGGELAIQNLLHRGYRPAIDFGYPYGLLPLLAGRAWYSVAGLSPQSFRIEVTVCLLLSAWGLARVAAYRRIGAAGLAVIALAIPDLMFVSYFTCAQSLEQPLLIHALAEQARGRRASALALLTACCFVKPSLAFVQGLAVVLATLWAGRRTGLPALARVAVPSVVTAIVVAAVLASVFGPISLLKTLSPGTGMAIYRASHYGFFHGEGRAFWVLPDAGIRDYFRYEVGFWLLATAFLIGGGIAALYRIARALGNDDDEIVATCAFVHILFVTILFGHRFTWVYSLPGLVLGVATLARRTRWHAGFVWILAISLLMNDRSKALDIMRRRTTESPSAVTLGLWSTPEESAEWARALELTLGRRPVLFAMCEGGALLYPGFAPPEGGYLIPGNMLPVEASRKARQLAAAESILVVQQADWPGFTIWPDLAKALKGCDLVFPGRFVRVYQRRDPKDGG